MDAKALRAKPKAELQTQLMELLKEQFGLRMQQSTGQLSKPSRVKAVRREIARIKTIMTETEAGAGNE